MVRGQGRLGGDTQRPRSGAARRSHLVPEARAATGSSNPTPKARGGGREGQPTSKEWWLCRRRRA